MLDTSWFFLSGISLKVRFDYLNRFKPPSPLWDVMSPFHLFRLVCPTSYQVVSPHCHACPPARSLFPLQFHPFATSSFTSVHIEVRGFCCFPFFYIVLPMWLHLDWPSVVALPWLCSFSLTFVYGCDSSVPIRFTQLPIQSLGQTVPQFSISSCLHFFPISLHRFPVLTFFFCIAYHQTPLCLAPVLNVPLSNCSPSTFVISFLLLTWRQPA